MTCYILAFPFILLFFQSLFFYKFFNSVNFIYSIIIISIISIVTASELGIYDEWKVKLNYKAISYLQNPDEVIKSAKLYIIISGLIIIALLIFSGVYLLKKIAFYKIQTIPKRNYLFSFIFLITTPFFVFYGLRGGWQPIPINQSDVYFSKYNIVNLSAVNSSWNLMHSIEQNRGYVTKNPFNYYDYKFAKQIVDSLHFVEKDTTVKFIETSSKPNIVFLILESWSADLIKSCGGYDSITPNFDKLAGEGLLFSNVISTGTVSDQGMSAILSGFPAQPTVSIIKQPAKYQNLKCFVNKFQNDGYFSSFHFGGQLNYGNIKGYIYFNNFDVVKEQSDLSEKIQTGRLGVHDGPLLNKCADEYSSYKEPFISFVFTLSSHSPFDFPMKQKFNWAGELNGYVNSVYYTDSCIGDFFKKAEKTEWFDNTVFILMPDHSHHNPKKWGYHSPMYRRIPLLFYGKPLKQEFKGKIINDIFAQNDVTKTILAQFEYDYSEFHWSKNMMNPYTKKFSYFSFDNGVGWVKQDGYLAWDHDLKIFHDFTYIDSLKKENEVKQGKSYLQMLFKEYSDF